MNSEANAYTKDEVEGFLAGHGVVALAKCCREAKYARKLLQEGAVHMKPLGYYRGSGLSDGTRDPYEGRVCSIVEYASNAPIYCMVALRPEDFRTDGKPILNSRMQEEFVGDSGAACLFREPAELLMRLQEHVDCFVEFGLVQYDGDMFGDPIQGLLHAELAPFMKNSKYSYQKEFRIKLSMECDGYWEWGTVDGMPAKILTGEWEPFNCKLGSLTDIAELIPAAELVDVCG